MGFGLRSTTATFVYMTHSAVVIRFETALSLRPRGACREGRERPPPKQGGHAVPHRWRLHTPLYRPPWGRSRPHLSLREGLEKPPFPSRFIFPDRSSPSRVRFAASRPGQLRADPKG